MPSSLAHGIDDLEPTCSEDHPSCRDETRLLLILPWQIMYRYKGTRFVGVVIYVTYAVAHCCVDPSNLKISAGSFETVRTCQGVMCNRRHIFLMSLKVLFDIFCVFLSHAR